MSLQEVVSWEQLSLISLPSDIVLISKLASRLINLRNIIWSISPIPVSQFRQLQLQNCFGETIAFSNIYRTLHGYFTAETRARILNWSYELSLLLPRP